MSRSAIVCHGCRATLAHRHGSGRLRTAAGTRVEVDADGRRLALVCGGCGARRVWVLGAMLG